MADFDSPTGVEPRRARRRGQPSDRGLASIPFNKSHINEEARSEVAGAFARRYVAIYPTSVSHPASGPRTAAEEARLEYIAMLDVDNECEHRRCPGDLAEVCGCFAEGLERRAFVYRHRQALATDADFMTKYLHRVSPGPPPRSVPTHKSHTLAAIDRVACRATQLTG
jgi:hypothetical protein